MSTTFPIRTVDGVSITGASDGYLWTQTSSVGWTRLPPLALAAVVLAVPTTSIDDLPALIKRAKKAKGETIGAILAALAIPGSRDRLGARGPSELERHVRAGCRAVPCRVCG